MAIKELTLVELKARIDNGDFVVYLEEEYGYRQWFWFPDMTPEELAKKDLKSFFSDIPGLPGELVPVPPNFESEEEASLNDKKADADPRNGVLLSEEFDEADKEGRAKFIDQYDAWQAQYYPAEALWLQGFVSPSQWTSHLHEAEDSRITAPEKENEAST